MGNTLAKLLCFGSFAGAWAHLGWEVLNLVNSKELFIGIVNVSNVDQMLDSSYW